MEKNNAEYKFKQMNLFYYIFKSFYFDERFKLYKNRKAVPSGDIHPLAISQNFSSHSQNPWQWFPYLGY